MAKYKTPGVISQALDSVDEDFFSELSKLKEHKIMKDATNSFTKHLSSKQSLRVTNCGSFLVFKVFQNTQNKGQFKRLLSNANFCKHRFCAMCQWRKSVKHIADVMSRIQQLEQDICIDALMLTLTVPNCAAQDLNKTVKAMSKAWNKFIKRKNIAKAILGWVRSLELMGDNTLAGQAHPHFHVLIIVRKSYFTSRDYLKQSEWRQAWEECYGYENLQVDVRRAKAKTNSALDPVLSACYEVTKYSVKASSVENLSDADQINLIKQTKKLRAYALGGRLKDYQPDFKSIDSELWQFIHEECFKWLSSIKDYIPN